MLDNFSKNTFGESDGDTKQEMQSSLRCTIENRT